MAANFEIDDIITELKDSKSNKTNLTLNFLTEPQLEKLLTALPFNKTITDLHFSQCFFNKKAAQLLAEYLSVAPLLTNLSVSEAYLPEKQAKLIAKGLEQNNTLKQVTMHWNNLNDVGALHIADAVFNHNARKNCEPIESLNLSWNKINAEATQIKDLAIQSNLKELVLSYNLISKDILKVINNDLTLADVKSPGLENQKKINSNSSLFTQPEENEVRYPNTSSPRFI